MEMFGPDFENYDKETIEQKEITATPNTPAAVGKATKGKVAAKATGHTYQFQIMESIGVPRADIKKFADPYHWLKYFPPICIVSIKNILSFLNTNPLHHNRKITHPLALALTGAAHS